LRSVILNKVSPGDRGTKTAAARKRASPHE
jgi:hypothetical protein